MSTITKRTRSQLTLPDMDARFPLNRSPWKDVRTAARNALAASRSEPTDLRTVLNDDGRDTDGGPLRISTGKKRSSSPFDESGAGGNTHNSKGSKRPRKDDHEESSVPTMAAGPFDFTRLSPTKSKFSLQHSPSDTPRRRAVSVPPTPPHVPHLDLKKIASPHKSPSKPFRPQFRFTSEPRLLRDTVISDEMEVDPRDVEITPHGLGPAANSLLTPHLSHPSPPSPLTPLPATPFPMRTPLRSPNLGGNPDQSIDDTFQITDESRTPKAEMTVPEIDIHESTPKAVRSVDDIPPSERIPEPSTPALTSAISFSRIPRPSSCAARPSSRTSESSLSSVGPSSGLDSEPPAAPAPPVPAKKPISRASRGRRVPRHAPPARLTRSASQKQKKKDAGTEAGPSKPVASASTSRPTTPGLSNKPSALSFAKPTSSSLSKTVEKSPTKKPVSLPKPQSPTKLFAKKPASQVGYVPKNSSLSNLSMALEKLKMPPPSRPGTSMGFAHRDNPAATESPATSAKDDGDVGRSSQPAEAKKTIGLQRASTVGSLKAGPSRPSAAFAPPVTKAGKINLKSGIVVGRSAFGGASGSGRLFGGIGHGRPFGRVSKSSSLPMVEGSPVKGGEPRPCADMDMEDEEGAKKGEGPSRHIEPMDLKSLLRDDPAFSGLLASSALAGSAVADDDETTPEGHEAWRRDASRRASTASQLLSQTLSDLPKTPPRRGRVEGTKEVRVRPTGSPARLKTLRSASGSGDVRSAPGALGKASGVRAHVSVGRRDGFENVIAEAGEMAAGEKGKEKEKSASTSSKGSLKVLKSCTILVDVRTDDGDDAGTLFVDMLKGLGARVVSRVGHSCTHIVFKNGLMSTLKGYRTIPDPKPHVVGIAWVVECVEQRKRVEEERFLIDLELVNVAGINKRRRSMLPKHLPPDVGTPPMRPPPGPPGSGTPSSVDQSMDSNVSLDSETSVASSRLEDDDLPPLERARRRKGTILSFTAKMR